MDKLNNCGVYIITNTTTNRHYIGSSKNIIARFRRHKKELKGGIHHNSFLQKAWNKYGENSFTFKTLKSCKPENRYIIEDFLIKKYKTTDRRRGFNLCLPSNTGGTLTHGPETLEKIKKKTWEHLFKTNKTELPFKQFYEEMATKKIKRGPANKKKVECLDATTNEILGTYESISDAGRKLGISTKKIQDILHGRNFKSGNGKTYKAKTIKGFIFRFV